MRDLRQLSSTLAKVTLVASRAAGGLGIDDVFKFAWPELKIAQLILRVAQRAVTTERRRRHAGVKAWRRYRGLRRW
jgi:hypothetical protein